MSTPVPRAQSHAVYVRFNHRSTPAHLFNRLPTEARAKAALPHRYNFGSTGYKKKQYLPYKCVSQQETSAATNGHKKVTCSSFVVTLPCRQLLYLRISLPQMMPVLRHHNLNTKRSLSGKSTLKVEAEHQPCRSCRSCKRGGK